MRDKKIQQLRGKKKQKSLDKSQRFKWDYLVGVLFIFFTIKSYKIYLKKIKIYILLNII